MLKAYAEDGTKFYLTREQDVVDAPSIGPKTAEQLNAAGIDCVDDLLKAHPIALAARLDDRHITEQTITDWQDQARLVCTIPGLRGTGAQLLVGAGYRTPAAMARPTPTSCVLTSWRSPRAATASASCATALRPTWRRSSHGSRARGAQGGLSGMRPSDSRLSNCHPGRRTCEAWLTAVRLRSGRQGTWF